MEGPSGICPCCGGEVTSKATVFRNCKYLGPWLGYPRQEQTRKGEGHYDTRRGAHTTAIPNPWLSESSTATEDIKARPAVQPNTTAGATDFSSPLEAAMPGDTAAGPGLSVSPDPAADRFVLDEAAFMNDIEPLPAFLSAPSQDYLRAADLMPVLETLATR